MRSWLLCLRLAAAFATISLACSNTPTNPSSNASLRITPDVLNLKVGDVQVFSATLVSTASERPVVATWASDNESAVAVGSNGTATARATGSATITATAEGQRSSRLLTVVMNVAGRWTGPAVVRDCGSSGIGFPCNGMIGRTSAMTLQLQQTGIQLTGVQEYVGYRIGITGSVSQGGSFLLGGMLTTDEGGTVTVANWEGHAGSAPLVLDGKFTMSERFQIPFGSQFIFTWVDFQARLDQP